MDLEQLRDRAKDMVAMHQAPTVADAKHAIARGYGFSGWRALAHHLGGMDAEPFTTALHLIEDQDVEGFAEHLDRVPELIGHRGKNDNDLLGFAAGSCDERLVRVALDHGADPASTNVHGWTALHQAGYSNLPSMARLLLDAGAPTDVSGHGDGGTPLVAALFWGHREVAEVLAERSLAPDNLRVAAGLDRDVDQVLGDPRAGLHRDFYRPHSGFPAWQPADNPAQVRDEALAWAARNGSVAALATLVEAGADLDADVYRGTALTWAAYRGRDEAVRLLLDAGATVNQRGTFGGPTHGQGVTALHMAAEQGKTSTVALLLDAGADATIRDDLHNGDAAGWADHGGHPDLAASLR